MPSLTTEDFIRAQIRKIISEDKEEQPEKEKKKKVKAHTGRGSFSNPVREAGALAEVNPGQLMKNLQIKQPPGGSSMEKIKDVIDQAVSGADAMQQAYNKTHAVKKGDLIAIAIQPGELDVRDATKYMSHTLYGAYRSGFLQGIEEDLHVEKAGEGVIVYLGKKDYMWREQPGSIEYIPDTDL
ncbi:MAG: hypothetical protein CME70_06100 [Halobacteriovorax sp.]|nr:hypothetical protein [Halobacteriovorax sp.]